jgi:hypothetical protein
MGKFALFVFNGDPMCFIHVLLNALDMKANGAEVGIVVEGAATGLLPELEEGAHPLNKLWDQAKTAHLIAGVCQACAHKMGTLENAKSQGLAILNDMAGHPGMADFITDGYQIVTF